MRRGCCALGGAAQRLGLGLAYRLRWFHLSSTLDTSKIQHHASLMVVMVDLDGQLGTVRLVCFLSHATVSLQCLISSLPLFLH
ncbi:hypothetical protein Gohar_026539 [Gossypium harknessii]|uniref:Uncharacterized protein n=1 Tax=Gossypium harknessii TaxID=34285 RepID=A0A7J9HRZ0_9ROSI|nr:hypothetical protein [Gossypium harknessii]